MGTPSDIKSRPNFDFKRNLRTQTPKFYDGWDEKRVVEEYIRIVNHESKLSRKERDLVIKMFEKIRNGKSTVGQTPDNTNE
jgi:hypothetical protein